MIKTVSQSTSKRNLIKKRIYSKEELFQIEDFMLVQRVIRKINSILDLNELLKQIIEDKAIK